MTIARLFAKHDAAGTTMMSFRFSPFVQVDGPLKLKYQEIRFDAAYSQRRAILFIIPFRVSFEIFGSAIDLLA